MTERPKGGPIRRKAGARRAEREARRSSLRAQLSVPVESTPASGSAQESSAKGAEGAKPAPRANAGRRIFEPGNERRTPSVKPKPSPRPERKPEPKVSEDKKASPEEIARQQEEARKLALDKGIPQVHALRVIRGEVSLSIVMKDLMRKEHATSLIEQDGLEPGLAGQVASGHLSRERALELQRIRSFRKERIDRDALKLAEINEAEIGVGCFDGSWFVGRVTEARTYECDFVETEGDAKRLIQKHDVKVVCAAEIVQDLRKVEQVLDAVRDAGLAGTADRSERVRPTDARLLHLIDEAETINCVLRDGSGYVGRVRSFGRWDMSIDVEGAGEITVLFHALHKSNTWAI